MPFHHDQAAASSIPLSLCGVAGRRNLHSRGWPYGSEQVHALWTGVQLKLQGVGGRSQRCRPIRRLRDNQPGSPSCSGRDLCTCHCFRMRLRLRLRALEKQLDSCPWHRVICRDDSSPHYYVHHESSRYVCHTSSPFAKCSTSRLPAP